MAWFLLEANVSRIVAGRDIERLFRVNDIPGLAITRAIHHLVAFPLNT